MTNIKTWLDTDYPEKDRKNITDLYLSTKDLEGKLELAWENFPKLERVWYRPELKIITNFDLKIASLLGQKVPEGIFLKTESRVEVKKYTPIEERMEELFPDDEVNKKITTLDLTDKGLRGTLDLSGFEELTELTVNMDCPWNRKSLKSNHITGLNLGGTKLILTNCPKEFELGKLGNLTNLEKLILKGSAKYPALWTNSLKELENLNNLTELDISYCPNIKTGLESIKNLEKFECKGTNYEKALKSFGGDVKAWKIILFQDEVSTTESEIVKKIAEYLTETYQSLKELNKKQLTDLELESKIKILERRNRELASA